jgi:hypothetical protein
MDWGLARDYAARDVCWKETRVTEAEWLAATDPWTVLNSVEGKVSDRKLRLVAVACCRRVWSLLSESPGRVAVEVAERHADGTAGDDELQTACADARSAADESRTIVDRRYLEMAWDDPRAIRAEAIHYLASACVRAAYPRGLTFAAAATWSHVSTGVAMTLSNKEAHAVEESVLIGLVRDIVGNPFRSTATVGPELKSWCDGAIPKLAGDIYDRRCFEQIPLLADALEDAGCTDAELLGHLRSPGPHVRGCWALDLVLGKS